MSEINRINVTGLKAYQCRFENEKNNFNNSTYTTFKSSYLSNCSDSKINTMKNKLDELYRRIEVGYNKIYAWWEHYLQDIEGIENTLSNDGRSGSINESLIRNYINSNLEELPDYFTDFTTFKIEKIGSLDFAKSQIKDIYEESIVKLYGFFTFSSNAISKTSTTIDDMSAFFSRIGANISNNAKSIIESWNKIVSESKSEKNKINSEDKFKVTDVSKDKGLFDKKTLFDSTGTFMEYDSKKELDDGTIEYYEKGKVIKRINPDGSCELFVTGNLELNYYRTITGKTIIDCDEQYCTINLDKIIIRSDGSEEYYYNNKLKRINRKDGTYELYKKQDWYNIKEVYNLDGSYVEYKQYDSYLLDEDYYLSAEYNKDGSHVKYNKDHEVIERLNADGSHQVYNHKYWDIEKQEFVNDYSKQVLKFERKADGTTYEYEYNKYGYLEIKCSDGSYKKYDEQGILYEEKLSDSTVKHYDKETGNAYYIENSDGTSVSYYESGAIQKITDNNGYVIEYNENGTISREKKENEEILYNEDGKLHYVFKNDGTKINYWDDGTEVFIYPDGSRKQYSPSGNLVYEKYSNGEATYYRENGDVYRRDHLDGYTMYNELGEKKYTIYKDGNNVYY